MISFHPIIHTRVLHQQKFSFNIVQFIKKPSRLFLLPKNQQQKNIFPNRLKLNINDKQQITFSISNEKQKSRFHQRLQQRGLS